MLHAGPSAYSQLVALNHNVSSGKAGALGVLFEAGVHSAYDTISFASFEWSPPQPSLAQKWTLTDDKTLRTDAQHCLDWTVTVGTNGTGFWLNSTTEYPLTYRVHVSACDPEKFPHQQWHFTKDSQLTTRDAGNLVGAWNLDG